MDLVTDNNNGFEVAFDPLKHMHDMKECDDGVRCIHCGLTREEILSDC